MSDVFKISNTLKLTNEKLFSNQRQLLELCALPNQLAESIELIKNAYQQPILGFQQQISTITFPQLNLAEKMQAQLNAMTAPIRQMQEMWTTSMVSDIRDSVVINDAMLKQTKILQESISSLASAFHGITIQENFVSVPDMLIPDDFSYEEVKAASEDIHEEIPSAVPCKRLSRSDAIKVIELLLPVLLWILTYFLSQKPALWQQQYHEELIQAIEEQNELQKQSNTTQFEQHQLVKEQTQAIKEQTQTIKEQTEYMVAIYNILLESDSDAPKPASDVPKPASVQQEVDSVQPDTDSCPQYDSSQFQTDESDHPTKADDSHNTDMPRQPD